MPLQDLFCRRKHDVGSFIIASLRINTNEYPGFRMVLFCDGRLFRRHLYGQGNKGCLLREQGLIDRHVLIETSHDTVTVVGNHFRQSFVRCSHPYIEQSGGGGIGSHLIAYIMVAIP